MPKNWSLDDIDTSNSDPDAIDNFDDGKTPGNDIAPDPELDPPQEPAAAPTPEPAAAEQTPEPAVAEPAAEPVGDGKDEKSGNTRMLPAFRYNFMRDKYKREAEERQREQEQYVAEREAMEQRIAELEAATQKEADDTRRQDMQAAEDRIDALEAKYVSAISDNNPEQAREIRKMQRKAERELYELERAPEPQASQQQEIDPTEVSSEAVDYIKTEKLIKGLQSEFPELKDDADEFNPVLTDELMESFESFADRMPRHLALERAARYVLAANGLLDNAPAGKQPSPAAPAPDVQKKMAAAAQQPPDINDVGYNSDQGGAKREIDISNMSLEDFENLSEEQLAKLER